MAEEAEKAFAIAEALRLKLEAEQAERDAAKLEWDELAHLYEEGTPSEVALHDAELYLTTYHALDEHEKLGKSLDRCLPSELGMDFYKVGAVALPSCTLAKCHKHCDNTCFSRFYFSLVPDDEELGRKQQRNGRRAARYLLFRQLPR